MNLSGGPLLLFQAWVLIFGREVICSLSTLSDFDSVDVYQTLDFQAEWQPAKHFWKSNKFDFKKRYHQEQTCIGKNSSCQLPPLEVFVVPFSHDDPFWLKTFEDYFTFETQHILTNAVEKLSQYHDMTFVYSEVSFLARWWDTIANASQKARLTKLVNEGRFEILTGGWVMPDEACPSLFALSQQLIEGQEWVRNNLNYKPVAAWSIDPFGHGSVMPYLLKGSGIKGMMIGRLHYAWKHWFGEHKYGDFLWNQRFGNLGENKIHCLNHPLLLYPTQHSCGPNPRLCSKFADWEFQGDKIENIADNLMGQYRRTASLTRHNVVVTGVGSDFSFKQAHEWDQQYSNYKRVFQFINSHPERYNAKVGFGTLSQYFKAVEKKQVTLPNFKGDFFPYSDIMFSASGSPSYWTGYYSTRPFWKRMSRKTENELRKAEVLFTYTFNFVKQHEAKNTHDLEHLTKSFETLVQARQLLALFQHHDGITGTSPRSTMLDVLKKLQDALSFSEDVQKICVKILIRRELITSSSVSQLESTFLNLGETELEDRTPMRFKPDATVKKLVLFNSLGWSKSHLVRVLVDSPNVVVNGPLKGKASVVSQINRHYFKRGRSGRSELFSGYYELVFIAHLEPFAITTYEIERVAPKTLTQSAPSAFAVEGIFKCNTCRVKGVYPLNNTDIILENAKVKVTFDGWSGLPKAILLKADNISATVSMTYGKYSPEWRSGAYISRPKTDHAVDILGKCKREQTSRVFVFSGPVLQEISVICERFMISYQLLQEGNSEALSAIHVTNRLKPFSTYYPYADDDGEYFMRFQTDLVSGTKSPNSSIEEPTFFSDNGLGVEKRRKVSSLPYQGNLYPVVNYAWIQDSNTGRRLSILMDRTHGFTSTMSGNLEAIIDRRVSSDDGRGMGEGVKDPELMVSNYVILLESLPLTQKDIGIWKPSLAVQRASKFLNYGPSLFIYEDQRGSQNPGLYLFTGQFPEDVFLLNFRTASNTAASHRGPGKMALLLLQNLGHLEQSRGNQSQSLLKSDFGISHYCVPTNLVGDPILSGGSSRSRQSSTTTGKLNVSKPFEVSAFAVYFEKSLNVLI